MKRCVALILILIVALKGCAGVAPEGEPKPRAPNVTVDEWASSLRKEGYQPRFLGRRVTFIARVLEPGAAPLVYIQASDQEPLGRAVLHNMASTNTVPSGVHLLVDGLIADCIYSTWHIWSYRVEYVATEQPLPAHGATRRP